MRSPLEQPAPTVPLGSWPSSFSLPSNGPPHTMDVEMDGDTHGDLRVPPIDAVAARAVRDAWDALAPPGSAVMVWGVDTVERHLRDDDAGQLERAVEKRRVEFMRGRACARAALAALGGPADAVLPAGPSRGPVWPGGFAGSITHTAGIIGAVVAHEPACRSIGIDVERGAALPDGTGRLVLRPEEREEFVPPLDIVAFSAKESIFKAVHPIAERWIGFQEARIVFGAGESFRVEWASEDPPLRATGLRGRYRAGPDWVTTLVWISGRAGDPPA